MLINLKMCQKHIILFSSQIIYCVFILCVLNKSYSNRYTVNLSYPVFTAAGLNHSIWDWIKRDYTHCNEETCQAIQRCNVFNAYLTIFGNGGLWHRRINHIRLRGLAIQNNIVLFMATLYLVLKGRDWRKKCSYALQDAERLHCSARSP